MFSLKQKIENKKAAMYSAINTKGLMDPATIKLSEELDVLIVQHMRGGEKN